MCDSRTAVGDELLQLGQVNLALHGLGLCQCAHMQCDDVFGQHLGGRGDPGSAHRPSRARSQHRAGAGREGELPGLEPVERRWPFSPWGLSAGKTTSRAARALPAALRRGRGCPRTKLHPGRPRQRQTTLRPDPAGPCISRFACNTSPSLEFLQKD